MNQEASLWVVGTFDTKSEELLYLADLIRATGTPVLTVDISTRGRESAADIQAPEVAAYHSQGADRVLGGEDRGQAVIAMGQALRRLVAENHAAGALLGVIGIGGSGGTSMIAPALHVLPYGMPKLLVSTLASASTTPFVDVYDIMVLNPVTDFAGLNRLSRRILANAAHAIAGMVKDAPTDVVDDERQAIGLSMFGVTTACVQAVSKHLSHRFDCQVFHANGMGGRTMEALARAGMIAAIIDITTTEVGQHLGGGVCDAGPDRLAAAAELGLPWIGSLGALDMINWGPPNTIPERHADRLFHVHNAHVTLMRTSVEEMKRVGSRIAHQLNRSPGPVHLLVPMHGLSALDAPGQPFHDPEANTALFETIQREFKTSATHILQVFPLHINDPQFARLVADTVDAVV